MRDRGLGGWKTRCILNGIFGLKNNVLESQEENR